MSRGAEKKSGTGILTDDNLIAIAKSLAFEKRGRFDLLVGGVILYAQRQAEGGWTEEKRFAVANLAMRIVNLLCPLDSRQNGNQTERLMQGPGWEICSRFETHGERVCFVLSNPDNGKDVLSGFSFTRKMESGLPEVSLRFLPG